MTILDALEKSKRLRNERLQKEGAPAAPPVQTLAARARRATDGSPLVQLDVPQLDVDAGICERNRVLLQRNADHRYSGILDSYRILRTRLLARGAGGFRSVGIISAGPGEGKSVTALNLALSLAREKKQNVVLLDLDLRHPSICRNLGVTPPVEIGSVLTGEARPEQAFFGIGVERLVVAGGMSSYENSSELLGSTDLVRLLSYINGMDPDAFIVVDLPPLLVTADALVVLPMLSAALMVVAEGYTNREQLDRAMEVLGETKLAGIVLNRSREAVEDYYA